MSKLFKRIAAVCMAAIMMATVLCTNAVADGTVNATRSGNAGNYTVVYSYSVDHNGISEAGFITGNYTSYIISFSPVRGTYANISIRNHNTKKKEVSITAPQAVSGGMPGSFSISANLEPNTRYDIIISSGSEVVNANGSVTIPHIDAIIF